MRISEIDIVKTNKIIGIASILFGLLYIPYSIYHYLNSPYYHLNPNIFYFFPPHQLTFFIVVWIYSLISIFNGILILISSRFCYHLYNILFVGLLFLNANRLISVGFSEDIIRASGNIILILISIFGFYYFFREDVRTRFKVTKKVSFIRYLLYIFITLIIYVLPQFIE